MTKLLSRFDKYNFYEFYIFFYEPKHFHKHVISFKYIKGGLDFKLNQIFLSKYNKKNSKNNVIHDE